MIPAWLLRYVPHAVILTAFLVSCVYVVHMLREQGRDEMRPVIAKLESELADERAARIRNEEALDAYQRELSIIRSRPRPSTPVRLCVPAVPQAEQPPFATHDSTSISGSGTELSGENLTAGPDIGPPLRDLAYQCDAENAKLRALQNWVRSWVQ